MGKAWENALKMGNVETLKASVEFDVTTETDVFDLGDIDLSAAGVRIEVTLNGTLVEDSDWAVDADDNTRVKTGAPVPVDNEINFKVFVK